MTDIPVSERLLRFKDRLVASQEAWGIALVVAGVLILVFPRILVWLAGLTLVLVGVIFVADALLARHEDAARPREPAESGAHGGSAARAGPAGGGTE